MVRVIIQNEFIVGPLWQRDMKDNHLIDDEPPEIIKNDKIAMDLAEQANDLYATYFDPEYEHFFREDRELEHRDEMLEIIAKLKARLEEINDGSYEVVDYETEKLLSL